MRSPATSDEKQVVTTSRSSDTCPGSCIHMVGGEPKCYAAFPTSAAGTTHFSRAEDPNGKYVFSGESNATDAMRLIAKRAPSGATVRHLESGDVDADYIEQTNKLAAARPWDPSSEYAAGLRMWGYTHRWREIDPKAAKGWTLAASVESKEEAAEALKMGWPKVAITSPINDMLAGSQIEGHSVIQCPNQKYHDTVGCADCNLCYSTDSTDKHGNERKAPIVEFGIHSSGAKAATTRIADKRTEITLGPRRTVKAEEFKNGFTDGKPVDSFA